MIRHNKQIFWGHSVHKDDKLIPGMEFWELVVQRHLVLAVHVVFGLFRLTVGKMRQLDACPGT